VRSRLPPGSYKFHLCKFRAMQSRSHAVDRDGVQGGLALGALFLAVERRKEKEEAVHSCGGGRM
jgi:hypothetical protein